ncbi:2OG-Fe(II) oxygenase [Dyadobacter frigoris]|uniref:Prolyl 4-hydroxylase subunit alpha n=1 Tax=Dyadobacter frigoris TaxID=2576211 RepID=A0A4V6BJL4_9BACT|nr:2OG-Fe(II) oxygenase [Dyadobacter frigoris]TKT87523.1 prolyl 4-hydroxylase subunit alpha [Dyadobacter frigoris]GLU52220.1 prolyl 4-hydroxylase [Dyadobacter frigoris]
MADYKNLETIDWDTVTEKMHETGYCLLPKIVNDDACNQLIQDYGKAAFYRKTILMERYRFGLGEYKYFQYPLPELIQSIREGIYPKLALIANKWMQVLHIDKTFPDSFSELQKLCHDNNQTKPTVLILKYGKGGFNTLHQDLYGEIFFPMQLVLFLNEPEVDYKGGEFVLIQQTLRAQSKAIVLKPKKGDILIFTTNYRPVKGSKGYYRANMKHGVSEVHEGNRCTLGIIFHDALS